MRKLIITIIICLTTTVAFAQSAPQKLAKAYQQFEKDPQLKHAISSLYVIDAATGKVVFDKNSLIGLAAASSQKIVTAATAFELLGKDYRYETKFYVQADSGKPTLVIFPSGDPTFGSWRWKYTDEKKTVDRIVVAIKKECSSLNWPVRIANDGWNFESIPDGWIWQDIGNYYGAGAERLNWRENQFDIYLKSGSKPGDPVTIAGTSPAMKSYRLTSFVKSAAKGTGDNAYVYFSDNSNEAVIRGTIPINENRFPISAAFRSGKDEFERLLTDTLAKIFGKPTNIASITLNDAIERKGKLVHEEKSPSLDSIIYWFLQKSINLYGEALLKTMAYEKKGFGDTDTGVNVVKDFWKQKNLDPGELNMYDGSGLSPLNRVSTHAQVEVLKYAKKQNWFNYFYDALPEYNGMKLKSGTISDVKAFCGYHQSKEGKEYILSFIVNNYSGSSSTLVNKMYRVLDCLK